MVLAAKNLADVLETMRSDTVDAARARLYLGMVYARIENGRRTHNLEVAIAHLRASMGTFSGKSFPQEWKLANETLAEVQKARELEFARVS